MAKRKVVDARRAAVLEVVIGSRHAEAQVEQARRAGLVPIERCGGPRDGTIMGWGRVKDKATGKPMNCTKVLMGTDFTEVVW